MSNIKKVSSITIILIVMFVSCTNLKYDIIPDAKGIYSSVKAKILFKGSDFKFSGKILFKYNRARDKILFLSPINQVYFELFIRKEKTLLINTKRKIYWSGGFHTLFEKMGNINFEYEELKQLILEGIIPEDKLKENDLELSFEKDEKSGKPKRIRITGSEVLIKLKIYGIKERKGKIKFNPNLETLQKSTLDNVLSNK